MKKKGGKLNMKKRKLSFERRENPLMNYLKNKVLLVRKLNRGEKNSRDISKEIGEFFDSPEKYFEKNSPVTIGKKINIFDMDDNRLRRLKKLKTQKNIDPNLYRRLTGLGIHGVSLFNSLINPSKNKDDLKSKFEVINNDQLKMIFDIYRKTDHNLISDNSDDKSQSSNNESNVFLQKSYLEERKKLIDKNRIYSNFHKKLEDKIPINIKEGLDIQRKKINLIKSSELENQKISKYLSRRIKKPLESLLLNRIESFRFKNEVIKEMEFNKPSEENAKFKWNLSLRRPEHFRGTRKVYVSLDDKNTSPFWSLFIEKSPKQKDITVKPDYVLSEGEIRHFKKQSNSLQKVKIEDNENPYFHTVENLDGIYIKGRNLFNLEYKREIIDSKTNKIWHKVFTENGKTITLAEVNKVYGNETFFKDYNESVTEKNMTNRFGRINFMDSM